MTENETPRDKIRAMIAETARAHGVRVRDLLGPSRLPALVAARRAAMIAVNAARPDLSTPQLGRIFGRCHGTVLHHLGRTARSKARMGRE